MACQTLSKQKMKLNLQQTPTAAASASGSGGTAPVAPVVPVTHSKAATALAWTSDGELFSAGDDGMIRKAPRDADAIASSTTAATAGSSSSSSSAASGRGSASVADLAGACPTALRWCVTSRGGAAEDTFAVSCSDGTVRLMGRNGRLDRSFAAHDGSVTCLAWNHDGTALATGGEDGAVKHWSQQGNLRSRLAPTAGCVYALAWAPSQNAIVVASGEDLIIKPLIPGAKETAWKAHTGAVLCVDWCPITDLIISGGEDCTYKVWDPYGRVLFQSSPLEFPVTSVRWAPSGRVFAVGSFESLVLCDRAGWSLSRVSTPTSGSLYCLDWTRDGTTVAAAAASGAVYRADITHRRVEADGIECLVASNTCNEVLVRDVALPDAVERLEVSGRITDLSIAHGHLVVATTTSLCIYPLHALASPYIIESRSIASFIVQGKNAFVVADSLQGLRVFQYDGKLLCSPRLQGIKPELLSPSTVSLGDDVIIVSDLTQRRRVHILDLLTGKPAAAALVHDIDITEIGVNQAGLSPERRLYFLDRNRDLYLAQALKGGAPGTVVKLLGMVDSAAWHSTQDLLVAVADGTHHAFICPAAYYQDRDIAQRTRISTECGVTVGRLPRITRVSGQRTSVRRLDGAAVTLALSPFPALLSKFASQGLWAQCVRLCRSEKSDALWAALSVLAVQSQQVDVAELAFSALEEVDKLEYMTQIRSLPSPAARASELLLYSKHHEEAERTLLQAGLVHRAVKLNIRTFNWSRALQLAVQYNQHIDTVLAYRTRFLEAMQIAEADPEYLRVGASVTVDWAGVQAREEQEQEQERARGQPYVGSLMSADAGGSVSTPSHQQQQQQQHGQFGAPVVLNSSINPNFNINNNMAMSMQQQQQGMAMSSNNMNMGMSNSNFGAAPMQQPQQQFMQPPQQPQGVIDASFDANIGQF